MLYPLTSFQSLIGRLKTWCAPNVVVWPSSVSIPYRQAKNMAYWPNSPLANRVSIPYRQAKNLTPVKAATPLGNTFQSLIGRLKTEEELKDILQEIQFQSLIGRLKTSNRKDDKGNYLTFQSLIGRLKTKIKQVINDPKDLFQSLIGRLKTSPTGF